MPQVLTHLDKAHTHTPLLLQFSAFKYFLSAMLLHSATRISLTLVHKRS